ncbi:2-amino-4-hydroxy-6-hydroxymethyldihydropteridine diphosphokinase [Agriterribacter sp.]|uniref:2-amino-4-hydroxy-6- hydroxymethyldihydropteridine diphosphokinase n=1 Tax=Agriterribacter sp. TaxID=2821509 RepID=UPI002C260B07|nr:2-amino-4-hydroxy-6-hydroxymethyldihydropteridine diphosphokinase [Agriterribacter sp.]HRO48224.1 2-amino-4-hydroxy-6-hydroxymethyldihydropteridine diphosphokinase [Agriterribacter sp.]HRQ19229.1 2-amino-4-hydroxy-6-hydroxymethyldihydropteridine diphosphokinase [Agriterribacter sp.]
MNKAYLLIGGNMGDRKKQLKKAAMRVEKACGRIALLSHFYETAAWGKTDQPPFYNQALIVHTTLPALELLDTILHIETSMGRHRVEKFGPRVIDIDILLFNDAVIHYPNLVVPHPELANRRFALEPLNEIAPDAVHPVLKKTISRLLKECPDTLEVRKLEN